MMSKCYSIKMKAVILAAGLGVRMKPLTDEMPKSMIRISGKPILQYKLESLPEAVEEAVIVIGYKGEEIKKYFGDFYNGRKIIYVTDKTLSGTAHALWQARDLLSGRFLVMMGDDIYSKKSLEECSKFDWSVVCKPAKKEEDGSRVVLNEKSNISDFVTASSYRKNFNDGGLIFTGLYSMTDKIFKYEPVKMKTKEEWGLPQTLLAASKDHPVKVIRTDFWISISSPEDLKNTEIILKKADFKAI
jgi:NDP-sugar pyrophosphorylase family protein